MADLNFPNNPTDGQQYNFNGVYYTYSATANAWTTVVYNSPLPISNTVNTQIVFNDSGYSNGSFGLTYDRRADIFSANNAVISNTITSTFYVGDGSKLYNVNVQVAYAAVNSVFVLSNIAFTTANAAFDKANTVYSYLDTTYYNKTNSAYNTANAAFNQDNVVFGVANAAFNKANNAATPNDLTPIYNVSNSAFYQANLQIAYAVALGM